MAEMFGYGGKILVVDLTSNSTSSIETETYAQYLGGRSMATKIHWDLVEPEVTAYDPTNVLTMITGPLTGIAGCGGVVVVSAISPFSGPVQQLVHSTFNGFFGPELKYAGWDGVIIKGRASRPSYVLIENDVVEIRDAVTLWGQDTFSTQRALWNRHTDKHQIATIGPAGEHLNATAAIIHDVGHATGYSGFGSVLGSKNLKAVVVRGTGSIKVADPQGLLDYSYYHQRLVTRKYGEDEVVSQLRGSYYGTVPTENTVIRAEGEAGTARIGNDACWGCPIHHGMSAKLLDGSEDGLGMIRCSNISLANAQESVNDGGFFGRVSYSRNNTINRLGLSTTAIWTHGFDGLMRRGILNAENTGWDLSNYGTKEFNDQVLHDIAYRVGFGDKVADGLRVLCLEHLKDDPKAEEAKAFYEFQAYKGGIHRRDHAWMIGDYYRIPGFIDRAVSNLGGPENRGLYTLTYRPYTHPLIIPPGSDEYAAIVDKLSEIQFGSVQASRDIENWVWGPHNVACAIYAQNFCAGTDSLTRCSTINMVEPICSYTEDHLGNLYCGEEMLKVVSGIDWTETDKGFQKFGDSVFALERSVLARQGHRKADDWPFDSQFELYKDKGLTKEALAAEIDNMYTQRGLDLETGIPTRETFERLGLQDIADDLEQKYNVRLV
jgi:aldehyde:ferredoxin oxidoreductase